MSSKTIHQLSDHVFEQIDFHLEHKNIEKLLVGLSGGLDSCVLLHVVANLKANLGTSIITAIHVNHGVHVQAERWIAFCKAFCERENIELEICNYSLNEITANREAVYRQARYEAFASHLSESSLLLTAHHQQDQAETVLFNLFRGGGVSGLGGMKTCREFANGYHLRPLLAVSRDLLLDYAEFHKLSWIDDPSNQDLTLDRNYIRHRIMPEITDRWPAVQSSMARTAELLNQAGAVLEEVAEQDIADSNVENIFGVIQNLYLSVQNLSRLNQLSTVRKLNAIKFWIKLNCDLLPRANQLNQIHQDLCLKPQKRGLFQLGNYQIRVYQNHLYLMRSLKKLPEYLAQPIVSNRNYAFDDLELQLNFSINPPAGLEFKLRQGGEKVKRHGQTKTLKKICQEQQIPTWERNRLPIIYFMDELVTVAGLDIHPDFPCNVSTIGI